MKSPGATVIPIIILLDKTQLTLFQNKTAYPVYLTIGNIPKEIRRKSSRQAQILLAYLPTTRLESSTNQASQCCALANIFHACLTRVVKPLETAGITGIEVTSGNGAVCRGHPIFAMFIGDYPEQLLVACCKNGECPKCVVPHDSLGDNAEYPLRNLVAILDTLKKVGVGPTVYSQACTDAGIKPVYHPFWQHLPHTNVFLSITPDILHQLYQGVMKHLISWVTSAFGAAEIDARCRRMPLHHSLQLFVKGISTLSRVSGSEHRDMCGILLGLIITLPLPGGFSPIQLVRAVRGLLDFLLYPSTHCRLGKHWINSKIHLHIFITTKVYLLT
jgi:hypothetical protein